MVFTSCLLPGCLVCETRISCRAVKQVDEPTFIGTYSARGVTVSLVNLTANHSEFQQSAWSNVASSILVYFNGNTDASEMEIYLGGREAGKWK